MIDNEANDVDSNSMMTMMMMTLIAKLLISANRRTHHCIRCKTFLFFIHHIFYMFEHFFLFLRRFYSKKRWTKSKHIIK